MPNSGAPASRVIAALRRHGAAESLARAIEALGQGLRAMTAEHDTEFAATVDLDTGVPVGGILRGHGSTVVLRPHLQAMLPDHRYASLHTHRRSTAFSPDDAVTLVSTPPLHLIAAVGLDATWFLLSKAHSAGPADPLLLLALFARAFNQVQPQYRALVHAGALPPDRADRAMSHHIWQTIAPHAGLRYDRVGRPRGY